MRWIAAFFTLVMLAAVGLAGAELRAALSEPTPQATPAQIASAVVKVSPDTTEQNKAIQWPALFGEPQPPKPPAPPPPQPVVIAEEPQPPMPPKPPLSSLGYQLKGIVRAGDVVWGMVSHPAGDKILRVGSVLSDDMTVARIDEEGLWVETGRDEPELLGFVEQP